MFKENLLLLTEIDPDLAGKIEATEKHPFSQCQTRQDEPNLCYELAGQKQFVHSSYSAQKEAERAVSSLKIDSVQVLYVYGIGLGYIYDAIKPWLKENSERYVVFLEDQLGILRCFLETEQASRALNDPQVMITYIKTDDQTYLETICHDLAFYYVGLRFQYTALPHYERIRPDSVRQLQLKIMHSSAYVSFAGQEFMNYGATFFRNFYSNTLQLASSTGCRTMVDGFKKIPAIICGAGPSLNQNFDLLKTLSDRALIFAGGSAINALSCRGMEPHFGGSVDPNKTQYERMSSHAAHELPTFYKGRAFHYAFHVLHGPRIYLAGNNMYPVTDWLEEDLGIEEERGSEGHNVLHLMIDLARRFGCDPIIFVGMDLAFTGMQSYASAVVDDPGVSEGEITKASDLNDNAFSRHDIHGKPVYTLWKWVAESNYTSRYAADHPDVTFINATEGGLGFEGIPNLTLQEVRERYLTIPYDLKNWVHAELQSSRFDNVTLDRVVKWMKDVDDSLESCFHLCEELASAYSDLAGAFEKGKKKAIETCSNKIRELDGEFQGEKAAQYILGPVNEVRSVLYERKFSQIEYSSERLSDLQKMLKRVEANREEMLSLKESAELNQALLRHAVFQYHRWGYNVGPYFDAEQLEKEVRV